ncbi:MAG TPA: hypothetical protein EYO58_11795, partial [Flavobacteriales bacterium]|nr:hypothetical protein [Flavobacteriales bacterium]
MVYILYNRWNKVISPMTFVEAKKIYNDDKISLTSLCKKTTSRCEKPAGIHPCCVDHLTVMLEKLSQILGSKLFILFGTALAWKRYNGKHMIPHDDDLDTGILAEHEYLLEKAKPLLEKEGFVLTLNEGDENGEGDDPSRSSDNSSKIKYPPYRYYDMTYSKLNSLHVDIALLTPSHLIDNTPVLIDAPQKWADTVSKMSIEEVKKYKTWIIPRDLILPVKSTVYLDVKTYRPNNIDKYLEYTYGKNYIVPYNRDKNVGSIIPVGRLIKTIPCTSNSYIGLAPILIINLDVDVERLHHLLVQCKDEKLYAYKKGNCCSDVLSKETESRFCFNEKIYPVVLVPGEKKCFLSHEMCWKAAAIHVLPSLIVEDDISFPFGINRILKRITDDISYIINNGIAPKAVVVRLGLGGFYGKKHFNSIT